MSYPFTGTAFRRSSLAALAALLLPLAASAANVGYYNQCDEIGRAGQAPPITIAGHTPVLITVPNAGSLAGLAALVVDNDNCTESAEYTANEAAIYAAVQGGMDLIYHDRYRLGSGVIPGAPGLVVLDEGSDDDIDFPLGSPILTGPGGALNNSSLDGGNSSNHGYVTAASLPVGSTVLATTANASQVITFSYLYGSGRVVYSTIPLDCYLVGENCDDIQPIASNLRNVYQPNVIAYAIGQAAFTSCTASGITVPLQLGACKRICEGPTLSPSQRTYLINLYYQTFRSYPPCVQAPPPNGN